MNLSILAVLLLLAGANACGPTNPALDLSKAFKFLGFPTPTMFFPKGSPCTIPNQPGVTDCVNGSTGWDIFLSFCGNMHAVSPNGNNVAHCTRDSVACASWSPSGSAKFGSDLAEVFSWQQDQHGESFLRVVAGNGDPVTGNPRQVTLQLYCGSLAHNEPVPTFTAEQGVPIQYMYTFKWRNAAFCAPNMPPSPPSPPPPPPPACGTKLLDLSNVWKKLGLNSSTVAVPKGSPCTIPNSPGETDCVNGKTGWDVLINFCGAVQGPSPSGYPITQCGGAAVCLAWAAQGSASAGSAATVAYTSNTTVGMGFTTMKVSGGSPVTGNPRQSTIELYCVPPRASQPLPTLTAEFGVPVKYMYKWVWKHVAFC